MPANYPGSVPNISQGTSTTAVNTANWNKFVDEINAMGQDLVDVKPGDETPFDHAAAATSNVKNALIAIRNVLSDLAKRVTGASNWYSDPVDITLLRNQIGQRIPVINNTGASLAIGDLVYISGYDASNRLQVTKARANALTTLAQFIIVDAAIANGSTGYISTQSILTAQNTSGTAVGDPVFLSQETAGVYLFKSCGFRQVVGRVIKVDAAAGVILFKIEPKLDDVPRQILGLTLSQTSSPFLTTLSGGGNTSIGNGRLSVDSGAQTGADYARVVFSAGSNNFRPTLWNRNSEFYYVTELVLLTAGAILFVGVGDVAAAADPTFTVNHYGFKFSVVSGTTYDVIATSSDGTTVKNTTISSGSSQIREELRAVYIVGKRVEFYRNGALVATHTSPTDAIPDSTVTATHPCMNILAAEGATSGRVGSQGQAYWQFIQDMFATI